MSGRTPHLSGSPLLYRVPDAAALLAISDRTLRRLAEAGELPAVTVQGELRFAHADLVAYVERLRRESAAVAEPVPLRRRRA